jgi:hypothetical protein
MAIVNFSSRTVGSGTPLRNGYAGIAWQADDALDIGPGPGGPCIGLHITTGGNVNVDLLNGGTAVLTGLPAGHIVDVPVRRVRATLTTATGIYALFGNAGLQ